MKYDAVIYTRTACYKQNDSTPLQEQENACREFCRKQGYEVAGVFHDMGKSGMKFNRPGLCKLLSFCRINRVKHVVVKDYARLSRNPSDSLYLQTRIFALGMSLHSVGVEKPRG